MTESVLTKKALPQKLTIKAAKETVKQQSLVVPDKYDKRFVNTWLYVLGYDVDPVERKAIVHKPKQEKAKPSLTELMKIANQTS